MPEIIINGPEGRIEARYFPSQHPNAPLAMVLHPHPEHGGTMNNKVVYALYRCFQDMGFSVIRFNFRGVGKSEGKFDHGEGELNDAATVLDWLQHQNLNPSAYWIAGFSFGAWVAMQLLMRRPEFEGFIAVSPPADMYDFSFLAPCPVSGMFIQGDRDEVVPKEAVDLMLSKIQLQKGISLDYRTIAGADHFYTNRLNDLMRHVTDYLTKTVSNDKLQITENK